jgi:hypothetical protein
VPYPDPTSTLNSRIEARLWSHQRKEADLLEAERKEGANESSKAGSWVPICN